MSYFLFTSHEFPRDEWGLNSYQRLFHTPHNHKVSHSVNFLTLSESWIFTKAFPHSLHSLVFHLYSFSDVKCWALQGLSTVSPLTFLGGISGGECWGPAEAFPALLTSRGFLGSERLWRVRRPMNSRVWERLSTSSEGFSTDFAATVSHPYESSDGHEGWSSNQGLFHTPHIQRVSYQCEAFGVGKNMNYN